MRHEGVDASGGGALAAGGSDPWLGSGLTPDAREWLSVSGHPSRGDLAPVSHVFTFHAAGTSGICISAALERKAGLVAPRRA
jgi:hypothetical protein